MKIVGIMITKENDTRFPGKHLYLINGKPMFMHGLDLMSKFIDKRDIYLYSDSLDLFKLFKENYFSDNFILRRDNACLNKQLWINILRSVYLRLNKHYDLIISILGSSINHDYMALKAALDLIINFPDLNEIRSFNQGFQSGIFVFREKVLLDFNLNRYPIGAVSDSGKQIHYEYELEGLS